MVLQYILMQVITTYIHYSAGADVNPISCVVIKPNIAGSFFEKKKLSWVYIFALLACHVHVYVCTSVEAHAVEK